jgi:hypothetical protein
MLHQPRRHQDTKLKNGERKMEERRKGHKFQNGKLVNW